MSPRSGLSPAPASPALEKISSHSLSFASPGPHLTPQFTPRRGELGQCHLHESKLLITNPFPNCCAVPWVPCLFLRHLHAGFPGQFYCNTDCLGSPGPPPRQLPAPSLLSQGPRAQAMRVSTVMSLPHLPHPSGSILDDTAFTAASKFSPFLLALSPQVFLTWLTHLLVPFGNI